MSSADGRVVGTTQIVNNGSAAVRWNVAIMGDGYQEGQLNQYHSDVERIVDAILATAPFDALRPAINVFRVDVASTDSGAKDPPACGGTGASPRTYFDATFCGDGQIQRLLVVNDQTALEVASAQVPQFHVPIVVVNSPIYGGSGGQVAVLSLAQGVTEIALHELGHSAFGLADEYEYWAGCGVDPPGTHDHHPPGEPAQPNVTLNSNRGTIKWRTQVLSSTPMPTTANPDCSKCDSRPDPLPASTVGAFEGADYYHCGAYRPEFNCRMRALGYPYCAVCQGVINRTLEPFQPAPNLCFIKTQNTPGGTVEVHIASSASAYRQRVLEVVSDFNVADHANGTWQVAPPQATGWPTLYFIKTASTGTGNVEVHWGSFDPATSKYVRRGDLPSLYSQADGANGAWQMCGRAEGAAPDLFFIKTQNTPGGWVEVHAASASSLFKQRILDVVSDFSVADRANGTWQLGAPYVNGWPTLYFVKTANCQSGRVEVHWCVYNSGANAYRRAGDLPTWFPQANGPLGAWQISKLAVAPDPVLFFIQDQGTAGGRVEVQAASGASAYALRLFDLPSDFVLETDGAWQMTAG